MSSKLAVKSVADNVTHPAEYVESLQLGTFVFGIDLATYKNVFTFMVFALMIVSVLR